jgi:5-methylthioribose kinase
MFDMRQETSCIYKRTILNRCGGCTMLTSGSEVKHYLEHTECLPGGLKGDVEITPLSGGVSSIVWKIITSNGRWVIKQALAKLNVEADWYSDQDRIMREQESIRWIRPMLPKNMPEVVWSDSQNHIYLMTCAPEGMIPWKQKLMDGDFQSIDAYQTGKLLSLFHNSGYELTAKKIEILKDLKYFHQLRIDPFHRFLMHKYTEYSKKIDRLVIDLTENPKTVVHGDFSPKNILVGKDVPPLLIDFEVVHFGNPIFDVAFMIGHLMLKGWAFHKEEAAVELIAAFLKGYGKVPQALLGHLGLMLMARIDGKSPVSYIDSEKLKAVIRKTGTGWLSVISGTEEQIFSEIELALRR